MIFRDNNVGKCCCTYFDLELLKLLLRDRVGLGNDRNDVDLGIESFHCH